MDRKVTTTEAGYGWQHQKLRARWAKVVESGAAFCARCGGWIAPGSRFDLDHDDDDRSPDRKNRRYIGVSHEKCNRATSRHRKEREQRERAAGSRRSPRIAEDGDPIPRVIALRPASRDWYPQ